MKSYLNDEERRKYEGEPPEPGKDPDPSDDENHSPKHESSLDFEVPERTNVVEQMRISIMSPKQLIGLSQLSVGRFVRYTLFITLLITVMLYVIPVAATLFHVGGLRNLFENKMSDFKVTDGTLEASKPFTISLGTCDIVVDTTDNIVSKDALGTRPLTFAIGKKKVQVIYTSNGLQQVLLERKISDFFPEGFDRDMLISGIPGFYIALILGGLFVMAFTAVKYLLAALLYMLIGWSVAKKSGLDLNKGNVFRLCFYAQTIGMILVNVNSATGGYLPGSIVSMVGIFITLHYVFKTFRPYFRYAQDE